MLLAALTMATQGVFAQEKAAPQAQNKYKVHLVKDVNGKEEVIDKTFDTKAEMEAFMKERGIDAPEAPGNNVVIEKTVNKKMNKKGDKMEKKIIIVEREESSIGKTKLEISSEDLTAEERAKVIQALLDIQDKNIKVKILKALATKDEAPNAPGPTHQPGPLAVDNVPANISELTLSPNPNNGQFHVTFNVGKPADIKLRITDLQGNEIYASSLSNYSGKFEKDINRPDMAKGVYLLDVTAGTERKTTKVVMQ